MRDAQRERIAARSAEIYLGDGFPLANQTRDGHLAAVRYAVLTAFFEEFGPPVEQEMYWRGDQFRVDTEQSAHFGRVGVLLSVVFAADSEYLVLLFDDGSAEPSSETIAAGKATWIRNVSAPSTMPARKVVGVG